MNLIQATSVVRCNGCADRHWTPYERAVPDLVVTRVRSGDGIETRYVCPRFMYELRAPMALFGV